MKIAKKFNIDTNIVNKIKIIKLVIMLFDNFFK